MPAQGLFSIGGIASGLDTAGIVQQLMQLERQPLQAMRARQDVHRKANEAWGQVNQRLSTLRSALDKVNKPNWLQNTTKATSSNEAIARVSTSGGALPGSMSLNVTQLATAHQVSIGGTFGSATDTVGAGTIAITRGDGRQLSVDLGDGATVQDAARALNGLEGINAQVVRVKDGDYRLVVSSKETGTAARLAEITAEQGALVGQELVREAKDAQFSLGSIPFERATNTVDDLMDGVTVTLSGLGEVTIGVQQDLDRAVSEVKGVIDGLNGLLNQLSTVGRSSQEATERGALAGDPLVRQMGLQLRGVLSQITGEGDFPTLSSIGIELTREGRINFDEGKLRTALGTDPQAVANLIGKASAASDPRAQVTATGRAEPGVYGLTVTQEAIRAGATGTAWAAPTTEQTISITVGSREVELTIGTDVEDLTTLLSSINARLREAGIETLRAVDDGGVLRFEGVRAGTSGNFTISGATDLGIADGTYEGQGAQGTFSRDGETWDVTSTGQTLLLNEGPGRGLNVQVPANVTGDLGTVTVGDGLGSLLDRVMRTIEGRDGSVARAREALDGRIRDVDRSIEAFEGRLEIRERSIRRQFTAMESAMARFNSQGQWLQGQLASMMGQS
ncbi:MAG: flagellar filament capping protein FliD [Nitriliruptoraceae bacterium]|nr:flagellar filament capping protein FliD [Nitriliruptoraceae bacterium]